MMQINRNEVTEPANFVWIPTGHALGEPTGMTGWWQGDKEQGCPVVEFPSGTVRLASPYIKMYEPTEAEIDEAIEERGKVANTEAK